MIDFALFLHSIPSLAKGALVSVEIAASASLLGIFMGCVIAFLETSKSALSRTCAFLYTNAFRGTPMLVQILFVFYVLPQLGIKIPALWSTVLAIGMNSGAYLSQVIRCGLNAVPKGQLHAARTLGLNTIQVQRYVVLPQVFRTTLPALSNELVTLLKDSSLASVIGVVELAKVGSIIRGRTYDAFTVLFAVTVVYLVLTFSLSCVLKLIEKRSSKPCSW